MRDFGVDQRLRDDPDHFAACIERSIRHRAHQAKPPATINDANPASRKFGTHDACSINVNGIGRGRRAAVNREALQRLVSRMTAIARTIGTGGLPDNMRALSSHVVFPA